MIRKQGASLYIAPITTAKFRTSNGKDVSATEQLPPPGNKVL